MASVVWMGVFVLLMAELVIVSFLVLPLPRMVRKFIARKIFTYDLGRRVRFISNFIILGPATSPLPTINSASFAPSATYVALYIYIYIYTLPTNLLTWLTLFL